jgi:hypothetical protein
METRSWTALPKLGDVVIDIGLHDASMDVRLRDDFSARRRSTGSHGTAEAKGQYVVACSMTYIIVVDPRHVY